MLSFGSGASNVPSRARSRTAAACDEGGYMVSSESRNACTTSGCSTVDGLNRGSRTAIRGGGGGGTSSSTETVGASAVVEVGGAGVSDGAYLKVRVTFVSGCPGVLMTARAMY